MVGIVRCLGVLKRRSTCIGGNRRLRMRLIRIIVWVSSIALVLWGPINVARSLH